MKNIIGDLSLGQNPLPVVQPAIPDLTQSLQLQAVDNQPKSIQVLPAAWQPFSIAPGDDSKSNVPSGAASTSKSPSDTSAKDDKQSEKTLEERFTKLEEDYKKDKQAAVKKKEEEAKKKDAEAKKDKSGTKNTPFVDMPKFVTTRCYPETTSQADGISQHVHVDGPYQHHGV